MVRLVQGVRVDGHLDVHLLGHGQGGVDGGGSGSPVFMQLEADGTGGHLLTQRVGPRRIPLAEEAQVDG